MSMLDYCMTCKHRAFGVSAEKDGDSYPTCKAFPDGIPDEYSHYGGNSLEIKFIRNDKIIKVKTKPHNKVVPGQAGNYVFEEKVWSQDKEVKK